MLNPGTEFKRRAKKTVNFQNVLNTKQPCTKHSSTHTAHGGGI
jgi:hypothetical protein